MDEELSVTGMGRPPRWRCRTCGAHGDFSDLVWAFDHVMMEHRRLSADCPSPIQDIYVTGVANLGLGEFYDHNPDVWEPFAKVYKYLLNWRHRQEIIDRTTWGEFSSAVRVSVPDAEPMSQRFSASDLETGYGRGVANVRKPQGRFGFQCQQCGTQFSGDEERPVLSCPKCGSVELHYWRTG
jgi:hypothetical protein